VIPIVVAVLPSPIGPVSVSMGPDGLCAVDFDAPLAEVKRRLERRLGPCEVTQGMHPAGAALHAYFMGKLVAPQMIQVATMGTPFQRQVWAALRKIPAGQVMSYADLASWIGRPTAVRAVASANGDNPVPIVIPCHRVIGADGSLTGYGGGLERKRWLLVHEKALLV
jgi:methylated-DNA-[protein]-cysteine S-methyltransferase